MIERREITAWITRSIPILLVAFLWVGLWKMWPSPEPYVWEPERRPFKITFISTAEALELVSDPTVFAFDSDVSFHAADEASPELLRMPGMSEGKSEFLVMSDQVMKARARSAAAEYSVWERREGKFEGMWSQKALFESRTPERQLVVFVSDDLRKAELSLPEFTEEELSDILPGWEAQVLVDIDKSGIPVHVLIEKGTGNKDIDALICRKILLSRAAKKETRGGRVTVSYGQE